MVVLRSKTSGSAFIDMIKEYEVMDYKLADLFELVDRVKEAPLRLRRGPQQYSYFNPI